MGQWDGATMQQKSFQLTALTSISIITKEMENADFILQHGQLYTCKCMCSEGLVFEPHKHSESSPLPTRRQTHTHTLSQKRMQNKLSTAYITLAICNLSCSPRKIIEATSQYANRMIISLTIANTWTEKKKKKSSYIVSNF